jgi:hypothetical protein
MSDVENDPGEQSAPPEPAPDPTVTEAGSPPPEVVAVPPSEPETGAPITDADYLTPTGGGRSRRLVVLTAALLVVATFLGVLAARFYASDRSDDERRDDVAEVAARLSLSFVTYDYRDLDTSIGRVRRDATPGFYREYERFMKNEGGSLLERTQAQSRATVDDVFLGEVEEGSASAFVVLTVTREGLGGRQPAAGAYLRLQLTKVDGKWLVEKVNPLFTDAATGGAVQTPQPAAPSSTTVAP